MKTAYRLIALLLCAVLALTAFAGCGGEDTRALTDPAEGTSAADAAGGKRSFEDDTFAPATALALGMRFFDDPAYLESASVVWNILGWYCVGQEEDGGREYLTERQVRGLQHLLRPGSSAIPAPENWIAGGSLEIEEEDGEARYYFPGFHADYKQMIAALQPAVTAGTAENGVTPVTVVLTAEDGGKETYVFRFRRDARASDAFPYVLDGMTLPPVQGAQAPGANFTLAQVVQANKMGNLLSVYSSVESKAVFGGEDGALTTYFKKNDVVCSVTAYEYDGVPGQSGFYGDLWFTAVPDADQRAVHLESYYYIGDERPEDMGAGLEYELAGMIEYGDISNLTEQGDTYEFDVTPDYGYIDAEEPPVPVHYAVDKGTLALRSVVIDGGTEYETRYTFRYNVTVDTRGLFDGWDQPLRTVTFVLELHDADGRLIKETKAVQVPRNLELLPELDREIAYYNNPDYTGEYQYPGYGGDYTLYVTDAMG